MPEIIGLDFGGCNTEIYVKGKGIVLREPSIAAVDTAGYVVAVGAEAILLRGRAPGSVTIRRPIRDSVISDFNLTAEMLDRFLESAVPRRRKRVFVAVKCGIGSENRTLIGNALDDCRVSQSIFIDSPLAAFAGSGYETASPEEGVIICDIGAGSIEGAYIRGGDILRTETYFGGGRDADMAICTCLLRRYGLKVTKIAAQAAKHKLDLTVEKPEPISISGFDSATGLPRRIDVPAHELLRCTSPQIKGAYDCVNAILSNLPRYAGKVGSVSRIILVGGGALLPGIADYIANLTECETVVADDPLDCVARGLGKLIEKK
jgi:rod shape-determining protein MreB